MAASSGEITTTTAPESDAGYDKGINHCVCSLGRGADAARQELTHQLWVSVRILQESSKHPQSVVAPYRASPLIWRPEELKVISSQARLRSPLILASYKTSNSLAFGSQIA